MGGSNLNSKNNQIKNYLANWLVSKGFVIFPLEPYTKAGTPKNWQKNKPIASEEEKKKLLKKISDGHNYAILCGINHLAVLDVEDKELFTKWIGGELALNRLCEKTLCVNTPHGGIHIYFRSSDIPEHKFNPVFEMNGKPIADLQSHNSYVVGPGCEINHKFCTSSKCQWKGQDKIDAYNPFEKQEINEINLKAFLKYLEKRGEAFGITLTPHAREWVNGGKEKTYNDNVDAKKLIIELKKTDRKKDVNKVKQKICREIGELKDITQKVAQAICHGRAYKDVGLDRSRGDWHAILLAFRHGVFDPDKIVKLLPADSKVKTNEKWDTNKYFLLTLKNAWRWYQSANKVTMAQTKTEKIDIMKSVVTDLIMEKYKIATFLDPDTDDIIGTYRWTKKKGIYERFENRLRRVIRLEVENLGILNTEDNALFHISKRVVDDIYSEIRDKTQKELPTCPPRVAFKNATVNWENRHIRIIKLEDREEDVFSFNYIPHEINVDDLFKFAKTHKEITTESVEEFARAQCPKSLETFKNWVGDKWILLLEIIGYTLYPKSEFKKAFALVGPRDSGKSSFIRLVIDLIGEHNVSSIHVSELLDPQNKFVVSKLYHKLLNTTTEAKEYMLKDTERLKALTGEDVITGDRKYRDPIQFKPYAKLLIATNELPYVERKLDDAFWSRWIIVEFNNQFPRDERWYSITFTEKELKGILTTAIIAFTRVLQTNQFDFGQSIRDIKDIWLSQKDSVYQFILQGVRSGALALTKNADDYVDIRGFYKMYYDYCYDKGLAIVSRKTFVSRLHGYFGIMRMKKKIGEERKRVLAGIRVISSAEMDHVVSLNDIDLFIDFVKKHNGAVMTFQDLVYEIGSQEKANRFVEWCMKKNFCLQRGLDTFEITL